MYVRGEYLAVSMPGHHLASSEGYVYIHRLKAEEKLGRKLLRTECVHHIDEDKFNNDIDNLMVFRTVSDHTAFHQGCEIYLDGDVYVAIKHQKESCPICGKHKYSSSALCIECNYVKRRKCEHPNRNKLAELIKTHNFLYIAKMYGVTDNTVRKWCMRHQLPYKLKDVKAFRNMTA